MTEPAIDIQKITTAVESWPVKAQSVTVVDTGSYKSAANLLLDIKGLRAEIEATFGPIVQKAHAAHKEAVGQRKRHEEPLQAAEKLIKARMGTWQRAEEQRQREQAALLAAEALARDEEARLREAEALEAAGETEAAERVLDEPTPAPPPPPPTRVPKVSGIAGRDVWKAEVTDLMALVQAVAAGKVPLAAVEANTKTIGQQARSLMAEMKWPGVRVWPERVIAAGGR